MKKLPILLILTSLTGYTGIAQTFVVEAGITRSKLSNMETLNQKLFDEPITGYAFSIGIDYLNHKAFSLTSHIGVMRRGGGEKIDITDDLGNPTGSNTQKYTFDYLSTNTVFNLKFPLNNGLTPYLSIGPRIDYFIHQGHTIWFSEIVPKKVIFGADTGVGIVYSFKKYTIGLQGQYMHNFNSISNGYGGLKNKAFALNTVFAFRLK